MNTPVLTHRDKHHRFPAAIISHSVCRYDRFWMGYRDVEELLFTRGVIVSYEASRTWCRRFGQQYATHLRRRRPRPGDTWHLDEVFLSMTGKRHSLWPAVNQHGHGLDLLVPRYRTTSAAKTCFRQRLKACQEVPRVLITDQLNSYGAAKRAILPSVEQRQHRSVNNRAEPSHQPTRQRERRTQSVTSPGQAQPCLAAYGPIAPYVCPRQHRWSASASWRETRRRCDLWWELTTLRTAT
jgi:putative transposase